MPQRTCKTCNNDFQARDDEQECGCEKVIIDPFGHVIHSYTRAQAISDGVLVDLMQGETLDVCRQHFKHPIACTRAVYAIMRQAVENQRYCNDYAGILHDILYIAKVMAKESLDDSAVVFRVIIQGAGRTKYKELKLVVGPGDNMEPVITIMLRDED